MDDIEEPVVMIRQKDLDDNKGRENTNNYQFPGQSARSKRWFDLDHEWLEEKIVHVNRISIKNFIK